MSESRFKFVVGAVCITLIAVIAIWRFSEPKLYSSKSTKNDSKLGEYVYVDRREMLHTDRKCSKLNYKGMTSNRISCSDLVGHYFKYICPNCVSDKQYEQIISSQ